jgi:hypothetical protein
VCECTRPAALCWRGARSPLEWRGRDHLDILRLLRATGEAFRLLLCWSWWRPDMPTSPDVRPRARSINGWRQTGGALAPRFYILDWSCCGVRRRNIAPGRIDSLPCLQTATPAQSPPTPLPRASRRSQCTAVAIEMRNGSAAGARAHTCRLVGSTSSSCGKLAPLWRTSCATGPGSHRASLAFTRA